MSGVTGTLPEMDECTECSIINDDYTITDVTPSACQWFSDGNSCQGGSSNPLEGAIGAIYLFCDDDFYWLLFEIRYIDESFFPAQGFEFAWYKLARASWSCMGVNTLDFDRSSNGLVSPSPNCTNWPASITVTPV